MKVPTRLVLATPHRIDLAPHHPLVGSVFILVANGQALMAVSQPLRCADISKFTTVPHRRVQWTTHAEAIANHSGTSE